MDGKLSFQFKVYLSPDGQECFRYKMAEDKEALQKKAAIKKDFAFSQSLLDFLYLDIEAYEALFVSVGADIQQLFETMDESLVPKIKKGLDKIAKLHIYFELLRLDWYARLDRIHHTDDLVALLPYKEVLNTPTILSERQPKAFALIRDVLDFYSPDKPVGEKMAAHYAGKHDLFTMPFRFTPVTTSFEPVDDGSFAQVLVNPLDAFELLSYFMQLAVERKQVFKQCKSCDKYFALTGYSTTEYCDREYMDTGKTCREIGANVSYQKKMEDTPAIAAYNKAYKKKFARIRRGKMTKEQFSTWAELARSKRDDCIAKKMKLEDYLRWLEID